MSRDNIRSNQWSSTPTVTAARSSRSLCASTAHADADRLTATAAVPTIETLASNKMDLLSIQYLRALAALAVVLYHGSTSLLAGNSSLIHFQAGQAGVDLFFVISGFIMFYSTNLRMVTPGAFFVRRLIRIVPLYFVLSTLAFCLARLAPHSVRTFSPRICDYLRSILFIPFYNINFPDGKLYHWQIMPVLGPGWTLNYEMFFYLVFGLCLFLPKTRRLPMLILILSLLVLCGIYLHPTHAPVIIYTGPLIMEFLFGVSVAYLFVDGRDHATAAAGIAAVIVAALVVIILELFMPTLVLSRVVLWGIPAAAILTTSLWLERLGRIPRLPFLLLLGDASYSLYLVHVFVLAILRRGWSHFFDTQRISTHALFMFVSAAASAVTAIVVYRHIERPITIGLQRYWGRISY